LVKLPKQLKFADRMGIRFVVIIGPDEALNRQVTIKDLATRTQHTLERALAGDAIQEMLATPLSS
jgi:histidyl-tRNA synthetase